MQATKVCSKCGQELPLEMFVLNKNKPDGRTEQCRPCNALRLAAWRSENRDHLLEYGRRDYNKNIEKRRAKSRAWQARIRQANLLQPPEPPATKVCPKCGLERLGSQFFKSDCTKDGLVAYCKFCLSDEQKRRRVEDPEWAKRKDAERWSKLTPEQQAEMTGRAVAWHKAHLPQRRKARMVEHKRRMATDPNYAWQFKIREKIRLQLKGLRKSSPTEKLLGCTFSEFRKHLQDQFEPWMTWHNYGNKDGQWSIDHRVPISAFDFSDPVQQKLCFNFRNQRPMLHSDNRAKACSFNPADMDALKAAVLATITP